MTTRRSADTLAGNPSRRMLTGGLLLLGSLALAGGATGATIAATTTCSNGVDNTGGLGLICEVTVVNTITASGGSATVTIRECHGAAGDPEAACTTETSSLTEPVTSVTQCNGSINGGGGTLRCSVEVTNLIDGDPNATAATVNQCVGSGGGITTGCDPFPATTTGAVITQCNGSANGGTLVGMTCTATGTQSPAVDVTVNQCNGSANGGGSLVICSANIENTAVAPPPTATPTAGSTAGPTPTPTAGSTAGPTPTAAPTPTGGVGGATGVPGTTLPPTDTLDAAGSSTDDALRIVLAGLATLALATALSLPSRNRRPR